MKSAEPNIEASKRSRGEASTTAPASGAMPAAEEIHVDPSGDDDAVDPTVIPPFSLHAMMESFMTTQTTHGQLLDELVIEVAALRADFVEYRSVFPPPSPSDA